MLARFFIIAKQKFHCWAIAAPKRTFFDDTTSRAWVVNCPSSLISRLGTAQSSETVTSLMRSLNEFRTKKEIYENVMSGQEADEKKRKIHRLLKSLQNIQNWVFFIKTHEILEKYFFFQH